MSESNNKRAKLMNEQLEQQAEHQIENKNDRFDVLGVIMSGHVYRFSKEKLYRLEPENILMNPNSGEFKKRINPYNHTMEYLEYIPDFELIIDYINGYDVDNFSMIFKQCYSRVDDFKITISKLRMTNLLKKMDYYYPILNINGLLVNISRKYIIDIEPTNTLLNTNTHFEDNVFVHFRDHNLFHDYFLDYIQGRKTKAETINKIQNLNTCQHNEYLISKINNDISYYKLNNLINL